MKLTRKQLKRLISESIDKQMQQKLLDIAYSFNSDDFSNLNQALAIAESLPFDIVSVMISDLEKAILEDDTTKGMKILEALSEIVKVHTINPHNANILYQLLTNHYGWIDRESLEEFYEEEVNPFMGYEYSDTPAYDHNEEAEQQFDFFALVFSLTGKLEKVLMRS